MTWIKLSRDDPDSLLPQRIGSWYFQIGVAWAIVVVTTPIVLFRFYVRYAVYSKLLSDDYWMILALVSACI